MAEIAARIYHSLSYAGMFAIFALLAACQADSGATLSAQSTRSAELATQIGRQDEIISYLATSSPGRVTRPYSEASDATISALSTRISEMATQIARQGEVISYLATHVPGRITRPPGTIEPTPYQPVRGSVEIEGGACCVGGTAGDSLDIQATFQASSPLGEVTQMRVRFGSLPLTEEQLSTADWESFANLKVFPIEIITNWVGYYVSVQYMDEAGNISQVYHDEIAVEGYPKNDLP